MKNIIKVATVSAFVLVNCQNKSPETGLKIDSVNLQKSVTAANDLPVTKNKIDLIDIEFGKSIELFLSGTGMFPLKDGWATNMDYVEYNFPKNKKTDIFIAGHKIDFNNSNVSIFYNKENQKIWSYEVEIFNPSDNNNDSNGIINSITAKIGKKPSYIEKNVNTKERPVFIDENGEPKTDHIEEIKQVWEDSANKVTYFIISNANFDKKTSELKIYVLDKSSPKYKEWVSYRSFDMFYNK